MFTLNMLALTHIGVGIMLQKLIELIDTTPAKQLGNALKRDQSLCNWLVTNTSDCIEDTALSERAYRIINKETLSPCEFGNKKRFISFNKGYGFCGSTGNCQCAKESVANKVSAAKKSYTDDKKQNIASKRASTNISKYGVANIGQSKIAKNKHTEFYANQNNVQQTLAKMQTTMLEKHGAANPMQVTEFKNKAIDTLVEKYGVTNSMKSTEISSKAIETKKRRYEPYYLAKLNYNQFIKNVSENFNLIALISKEEYIGIKSRPEITFKCKECGNIFDKRFDYANIPICKICHPTDISYKSKQELEVLEFVKSIYKGIVISGERSIINPYEIDIYIPELKIGIEYCGLYWHSEMSGGKSWNYHFRKWQAAKNHGIDILTIFSDEWLDKKHVVQQIISHRLNTMNGSIYARKCAVVEVSRQDATKFYNQNHLLGSPKKLPINYGLMYNNQIVAVMSFIGSKNNFELVRFSSIGRIVGGASKLFTAFCKTYNPLTVYSFSDNRYSTGELYKKLNFTQTSTVPPMQYYVELYQKRYHKKSLSKPNIEVLYPDVDLNDTEWNVLKNIGYDRIWDCGKIKWEYKHILK